MRDVLVPELAESITEGTIIAWLKEVGDTVEAFEPIAELETDKINVEIPAEEAGVLSEVLAEIGDDVEVGEVIGKIDTAQTGAPKAEPAKEEPAKEEPAAEESAPAEAEEASEVAASSGSSTVLDTPSARKRARETGETQQVVEPTQEKPKTPAQKPAAKAPEPEVTSPDKPVEVVKMSRRRQAIARNLVESRQTTAMLTTFNEIDMSAIMNLRKEVQEEFVERHDVKLGFMSLFAKAVISGLKKYPAVNAELQDDQLLLKKYYNIGIAVSAEEGLVVPVVKDADRMNFAEIELEIKRLAGKARDNKLGLDDMQDGTFTITNGGVFGSLFSTPIINMPQVGILGMHGIFDRPIVDKDGNQVIRPMMYIALSYDHRVIDGETSVGFLKHVKDLLEDPRRLLLEG